MVVSPYDPEALSARAREWRNEAMKATIGAMRDFCFGEAEKCERSVELSRNTHVLAQPPEP